MSIVFASLFLCLFIASIASEYRDEALAEINARRSAHCAAPLAFDSDLNKIAQSHAITMCQTRSLQISNNRYRGKFLGENLYLFQSSAPIDEESRSGSEPITSWYNEQRNYQFESPGFSSTTGDFTQLVWQSSKLLGFGHCCTDDQHTCYVVANFFPAGNVQGQFEDNVRSTFCR